MINAIGKPLARLTKKNGVKPWMIDLRKESGALTTDAMDVKRMKKEFCK